MERDRGAFLTIRAATLGVVDFRQARLLELDWWKRLHLLLRGMQVEDNLRLQDASFRFSLALVSNSGLTESSFKASQEDAKSGFYGLLGTLRPWEGKTYEERKAAEYEELRELYIQICGNPNDPEFQRKLAADQARWQAQQAALTSVETDDQKIMRKLYESRYKQGR